MKTTPTRRESGTSRPHAWKLAGIVLAGLTWAGAALGQDPTQQYSYFEGLEVFPLGETLAPNEIRITFLGSSCIPRTSQECNSVFIEVGQRPDGKPLDQFVFDCGMGVATKYNAMGIPLARMDKIFLTHLHADHMSDLSYIYCFGPATDRKSPLYVWGPGPSKVKSTHRRYPDGTKTFCKYFRKAMRWHTESFGFESTSYAGYVPPTRESWGLPVKPVPVDNDADNDAYALVPIELDWTKFGEKPGDNVAYNNPISGVKITHFPAVHCRQGSISYKLEWNGMSVIFSGDTKPTYEMIHQAGGVDVLIHEMVMPAEVWAKKNLGITDDSQLEDPTLNAIYQAALANATAVQNSSHTPQGAFGYILTQINPLPRLTVATHFQVADDTLQSALDSVQAHFLVPGALTWPTQITWATDLMVINVSPTQIRQRKAVISAFAFYPFPTIYQGLNTPKYNTVDDEGNVIGDPYAQIDKTNVVPAKDPDTGEEYYRDDGY